MMNPELKKKWIAALRSGEYRQGEGRLFYSFDGSYCCLGVLCKIAGGKFGIDTEEGDYMNALVDGHYTLTEQLDGDLREYFGIPETIEAKLMGMNDGCGEFYKSQKPFSEIADYIEAEEQL